MGGGVISDSEEITQLIQAHGDGDPAAYDLAVELLYGELRALAHGQLANRYRSDAPFQTTALVNEAYIKLKTTASRAVDRNHFLAIAATAMRHVIIDYARSRRAEKRGGDIQHVDLDAACAAVSAQAEELLNINDALDKLSRQHPRLGKVFECKFFAGLDNQTAADVLNMSTRTVQRDWMKARAFLQEYLTSRE